MNKETNTGGNAFPCDPFIASKPGNEASAKRIAEGMSLRDYFAAKAMQAYLSGNDRDEFGYGQWAKASYAMADAMIRARGGVAP